MNRGTADCTIRLLGGTVTPHVAAVTVTNEPS